MPASAYPTLRGRLFRPQRTEQREGESIINISSIHGVVNANTFTSLLPDRQGGDTAGVRLSGDPIRPEGDKGLFHPHWIHQEVAYKTPFTDPELLAERTSQVTLGRFAKAREIVEGILFLACTGSSYITGTKLVTDGAVIAQWASGTLWPLPADWPGDPGRGSQGGRWCSG